MLIKARLEQHVAWKSKVIACLAQRWNNSFCVDNNNKKITATNYLGDSSDCVPTSQGLKHFLHYDAAMIKSKANRIPVIARKLGLSESIAQERISFIVHLTAYLDQVIFGDGLQPYDITIGGEGEYRIKVSSTADLEPKLQELRAAQGMQPWGVSKSYKLPGGLKVHTFIDLRWNEERFSTIF